MRPEKGLNMDGNKLCSINIITFLFKIAAIKRQISKIVNTAIPILAGPYFARIIFRAMMRLFPEFLKRKYFHFVHFTDLVVFNMLRLIQSAIFRNVVPPTLTPTLEGINTKVLVRINIAHPALKTFLT